MKLTDEVLRQISTDTGWSFYTVREIVSAIPERPAPAPEPDSAFGAMVDEAHIPPEPDDQFGNSEQTRRVAAIKGACARAGGFPKDAVAAGYGTGRNADSWIWGWEYCNDCLCDPDYRYAPEPAPQRADAAVVKRMLCAFYPATEHIFSLAQYERMTDALAVARRGMVPRTEGTYTLKEVEEAIQNEAGYCQTTLPSAFVEDVIFRLTAPPAQERVTISYGRGVDGLKCVCLLDGCPKGPYFYDPIEASIYAVGLRQELAGQEAKNE